MHEFPVMPPAPFSFKNTAAFLSPGPGDVVDVYDGKRYTRMLEVNDRKRLVLVSSLGTAQRPELIVTLMNGTHRDEHAVALMLTRMLGLSFDPKPFYQLCRRDQFLYGFSSDYYGLRPVQRMHPFEALVTALIAEQTGQHFLTTSVSQLAIPVSYWVAFAGERFYAFPGAQVLAKLDPRAVVNENLTFKAVELLVALSREVAAGQIDLVGFARLPLEVMLDELESLRGIGPVGAQLSALLGYGRLDCFPSTDLILQQWIGRNYKDQERVTAAEAAAWADPWGSMRGLVALHIYAELLKKDFAASRLDADIDELT